MKAVMMSIRFLTNAFGNIINVVVISALKGQFSSQVKFESTCFADLYWYFIFTFIVTWVFSFCICHVCRCNTVRMVTKITNFWVKMKTILFIFIFKDGNRLYLCWLHIREKGWWWKRWKELSWEINDFIFMKK